MVDPHAIPCILRDRSLESWSLFSNTAKDSSALPIERHSLSGNGSIALVDGRVEVAYAGDANVYQLRYTLEKPLLSNGVSVRFRLRGWQSLAYVAIGYSHENVFRHVKIPNAARGTWVEFSIGHADLAFGLQNDWQCPADTLVGDIRVFLKGTPGDGGAWLDVEELLCWRENTLESAAWLSCVPSQENTGTNAASPLVSADLLDAIYSYLKKCFRTTDKQAELFLSEGKCPLYGETALFWPQDKVLPPDLETINTYRFSWHSLHTASILMVYARDRNELAPLFAAREFISTWLDRSYFQPDPDKKYAWYDHGTAERLVSMVLMWAVGREYRFDRRFMTRLRGAIFRHGQLLASELFYASHQPTRYHNHAWFQDLALMATALALPDFPCSERWLETALSRLTDQLDTLIVRDNGYAIFVENSIGYHQGVQRLVEFAGDLVTLSGRDSHIPEVARELSGFSDFLRYPDNRAPAQGDTFRRGNATGADIRRLKPYLTPTCVILPKAGYAVVKGNHDGCRFMMTMLATSLCRTHKHEDNLSFTLFFDGLEWLIDPSFHSHEYTSPIPAYLRSAVAHNALTIPGRSYSIEPGMANLDGQTQGEEFVLRGSHRAYDGVLVSREVRGRVDRLEMSIVDQATAAASTVHGNRLKLMLHCGEKINAEIDGMSLTLTHQDSDYLIKITLPGDRAEIYDGYQQDGIIRGMTGLGFMEQEAIKTIECEVPFNIENHWQLEVAPRVKEICLKEY